MYGKWSNDYIKAAKFSMLIFELQTWILSFLWFYLLEFEDFCLMWPMKESYLFSSSYNYNTNPALDKRGPR